MIQEVVVGLIFLVALAYVGKLGYNAIKGDASCPKGCDGACSSINVDQIEDSYKSKA